MKIVVVNDTNVFIDLFDVGLLEEFFSLPWEVHGIIYVFDSLKETGILSATEAAAKIRQLYSINPRLPKEAIERRLRLWEDE